MNRSNQLANYFAAFTVNASFAERPQSITGDFRVAWRLAVVCLLLSRGRANTLTFEHLGVLWWAVRSRSTRSLLLRWFAGEASPDELLIRYDPSLSVTLDLAAGSSLVSLSDGAAKLTAAGVAFATHLMQDGDFLREERAFVTELPSTISRSGMSRVLEWR